MPAPALMAAPMPQLLPVNELFVTIQGEGTYTGTPSTFVRLQGCAVGCPWCDTKHTWSVDHREAIKFDAMLSKEQEAPTFAMASVEELVLQCVRGPTHVVITGGEPCDYDLVALTKRLDELGHDVQIETSGTAPIRAADKTWVTVSPKIGMPGGLRLAPGALERANEIKMPVGSPRDVERLHGLLKGLAPRDGRAVWLQPLSLSPKATALCVSEAILNDWRVSIQTHKLMGVR